jgi:hypothetical protein
LRRIMHDPIAKIWNGGPAAYSQVRFHIENSRKKRTKRECSSAPLF